MSRAFSNAVAQTTIFFQINRWKSNGQTPEEAYDSLELHGEEKPPRDEFISKINSLFPSYLMNDIRKKRDRLLEECDWTQSRDVDLADNEAWVTYRQTLRDLPQTITPVIGKPLDDYFPTKPNA